MSRGLPPLAYKILAIIPAGLTLAAIAVVFAPSEVTPLSLTERMGALCMAALFAYAAWNWFRGKSG